MTRSHGEPGPRMLLAAGDWGRDHESTQVSICLASCRRTWGANMTQLVDTQEAQNDDNGSLSYSRACSQPIPLARSGTTTSFRLPFHSPGLWFLIWIAVRSTVSYSLILNICWKESTRQPQRAGSAGWCRVVCPRTCTACSLSPYLLLDHRARRSDSVVAVGTLGS